MYALFRTSCGQIDTGARRATESAKVVAAGDWAAYLLHLRELAFIMRLNGMLFIYKPALGAFVNALENLTNDDVVAQKLYDFGWDRRLDPDKVRLPR